MREKKSRKKSKWKMLIIFSTSLNHYYILFYYRHSSCCLRLRYFIYPCENTRMCNVYYQFQLFIFERGRSEIVWVSSKVANVIVLRFLLLSFSFHFWFQCAFYSSTNNTISIFFSKRRKNFLLLEIHTLEWNQKRTIALREQSMWEKTWFRLKGEFTGYLHQTKIHINWIIFNITQNDIKYFICCYIFPRKKNYLYWFIHEAHG